MFVSILFSDIFVSIYLSGSSSLLRQWVRTDLCQLRSQTCSMYCVSTSCCFRQKCKWSSAG